MLCIHLIHARHHMILDGVDYLDLEWFSIGLHIGASVLTPVPLSELIEHDMAGVRIRSAFDLASYLTKIIFECSDHLISSGEAWCC
jgi:hypothetical protein